MTQIHFFLTLTAAAAGGGCAGGGGALGELNLAFFYLVFLLLRSSSPALPLLHMNPPHLRHFS